MKLKRAYAYLFYRLYLSLERYSCPPFWSEWKASLLLSIFNFLLIYSFLIFYVVIVDRYSKLANSVPIMISIVVSQNIINYMMFFYKDQWKEIISEFNKLSKEKNKKGFVFANVFFVICIISIIYSFYLMSQVDWSLYR